MQNALFTLTRDQSRRLDRWAIDELGYPGCVLMENAGRGCADALEREGVNGRVVILCGKGANGGDGFVIARHLTLRGFACRVVLAMPAGAYEEDAATALKMLRPCDVPIVEAGALSPETLAAKIDPLAENADWIVDALLGTGAAGPPRAPVDSLIRWANAKPARRAAIDLPTGLDADTGAIFAPCFRADLTLTMVAPKAGFASPEAAALLGRVEGISIGVPDELTARWLGGGADE